MKNFYPVVIAIALSSSYSFGHDPIRTGGAVNGVFRQAGLSAVTAPVLQPPVVTPPRGQHQRCEAPPICKAPTLTGIQDYTDFMFSFTLFTQLQSTLPTTNTVSDCSCLEDKFRSRFGDNFERTLEDERSRVNQEILKAASKKFLNDYAANIEDASFFLLKTGKLFADSDTAKDIQCNNPAKFDLMVEATCGGKMDFRTLEERKLFMLNSLGGASRPGMSFPERLRQLSRDVLFLPIPGNTGTDGKPLRYSRTIYDSSRIGMSRDPEGRFVEHLVQKMLGHPEIAQEIETSLQTKTPLEAVFAIINREVGSSRLLTKIGADTSITGTQLESIADIKEDFKFLMNTHPGFMNVMNHTASFRLMKNVLKRDQSKTLLEQLETNPDILGPMLTNRCDSLTKQFADVICTPDSSLISQVDPADLEGLLHPEGEEENESSQNELHELLTCQEKSSGSNSALAGLSALNSANNYAVRRSDYLERLIEPDIEKHTNSFSVTMLRSFRDKDFRKEMEDYATKGNSIASTISVSSGGVLAYDVYVESVADGSDFSIGKRLISRSEARSHVRAMEALESRAVTIGDKSPTETRVSRDKVAATETDEETKAEAQRTIASVPETKTFYSSANTQNVQTVQRRELTRELSQNNPQPEVERHMSKLDDKTVSEIAGLREMLNTNFMGRLIADEEKRLEEWRNRLSRISSGIPDGETMVPEEFISPPLAPTVTDAGTSGAGTRTTSTDSAGTSFTTSGQTTGASAPPRQAEAENISNGTTERRGEESSREPSGTSSLASLTIVSSTPKAGDVSSDVIDEDVAKYLTSIELKPGEFEELQRTGLVYQYQVMVDNVLVTRKQVIPFERIPEEARQLLQAKYARNRLEAQSAKLAVLRMLMNVPIQ